MSRDVAIFLWTVGVLLAVGAISYAIDDLHSRRYREDEIDRELRELIGEDK